METVVAAAFAAFVTSVSCDGRGRLGRVATVSSACYGPQAAGRLIRQKT